MQLFFSVGEPSGDQHAAKLMAELRRQVPHVKFSGFGGPKMQETGFECLFPLTDLAVMGVLPVIPLLFKFYRVLKLAEQHFEQHQPDAVVLIDFPGFNWWVARKAKAAGIPVIYYMPPQLWAWAPWRIKKVRRLIDHILCPLSFEEAWYSARGVSAECVGHPFFDEIAEHALDPTFLTVQRDAGKRLVGLLPGSRTHEVINNWPRMLHCVQQLAAEFSDVDFLAACYSDRHRIRCEEILQEYEQQHQVTLPIQFHVGKTPEIIEVATCCLLVSGSVSLELLGRATPGVVMYFLTPVFAAVGRLLVTCKYASLPNLIADRMLMPEFFPRGRQMEEVEKASARLASWLRDEEALEEVTTEMQRLRDEVASTGGIERAADAILQRLQVSRSQQQAA